MGRPKRRVRRVTDTAASAGGGRPTQFASSGLGGSDQSRDVADEHVNIRNIGVNKNDEGVLYEHRITERPSRSRNSGLQWRNPFRSSPHPPPLGAEDSEVSGETGASVTGYRATYGRGSSFRNLTGGSFRNLAGGLSRGTDGMADLKGPQSDTLKGFRSFYDQNTRQYTIASKNKYKNRFLNWLDNKHLNLIGNKDDTDNNVYNPGTYLYRYIDWTFYAGFMSVFVTFLFIYFFFCVLFGFFLMLAGNAEPECITASGDNFGVNLNSRFSDAFALSWNTFTTVGYGMAYTSTSTDLGDVKPSQCSLVVLICTVEAFTGLLFAGMCAAILFGKVNRIQSHANIIFCNAVCLQYEETDEGGEDEGDIGDSRHPNLLLNSIPMVPEVDIESPPATPQDQPSNIKTGNTNGTIETPKFMDQFNGCPVLKFQVVNEHCNREGSEIVDAIMKVVGIKFKGPGRHVTHSQYVRVNLMDFEHPFLSRVWTGVHVLDATSPLLIESARKRIRENNGSWPSHWFDPDKIRTKLEFHDLIVTIAGISNVSAVTVHAYKRYKIGDVLIGYNFAPIVFRDPDTGVLEVDMSMVNDVREQSGMRGEDLSARKTPNKDVKGEQYSSIRIKKSRSGDPLSGSSSSSIRKSISGINLASLGDVTDRISEFARSHSPSIRKSQSSVDLAGPDSLSMHRHSSSMHRHSSSIHRHSSSVHRHSSSTHGGKSGDLLAGIVEAADQPADVTSQPPTDSLSIRNITSSIGLNDLGVVEEVGDVTGLGVPWSASRISTSRKSRLRRATVEGLPPSFPSGLPPPSFPSGLPPSLPLGLPPPDLPPPDLPSGSGDGLTFRAKPDGLAFKAKSPKPSVFNVPDIKPVVNKERDGNNGLTRNSSGTTMLVSNCTGEEGGEPEMLEDDVEAGITMDGGGTPVPAGTLDKDNNNDQDGVPLFTVG